MPGSSALSTPVLLVMHRGVSTPMASRAKSSVKARRRAWTFEEGDGDAVFAWIPTRE